MNDALHFVLGLFGNAFGLLFLLSPVITFKRIVMKKSTEEFSGIPYVIALLNMLLQFWYALPFVSPNNLLVSIIAGIGIVLQSTYVTIFLIFAPQKEKLKILGLLAVDITVFAAIAVISLLAFHGESRTLFCGFPATILSVGMYAAPLTIIKLVITTKSVEFMPFFLSLFAFLGGVSWLSFGLVENDAFVALPNGLGGGLGAVQLILYAIYRNNRGTSKKSNLHYGTQDGMSANLLSHNP